METVKRIAELMPIHLINDQNGDGYSALEDAFRTGNKAAVCGLIMVPGLVWDYSKLEDISKTNTEECQNMLQFLEEQNISRDEILDKLKKDKGDELRREEIEEKVNHEKPREEKENNHQKEM